MDFIETFKVSITAIKTNRTRSFLTALGVIIGVASVILLVSIGSGIQAFVNDQFEQLGTNTLTILPGKIQGGAPSFSASKLTDKEIKEIENIPSIIGVGGGHQTFANLRRGSKSKYVEVDGVNPNFGEIFEINIEFGRFINNADVSANKRVVVIGESVNKELFTDGGNPVGKEVTISGKKYEVVGKLETQGSLGIADADAVAYIPDNVMKAQFNLKNYATIVAKFEEGANSKKVVREVKHALLKTLTDDDFTVMSREEMLKTVSSIISTITAALGGIAAVSLLVGGIGIMNIMLVSVTERTREIGIRKAVGATPKIILTQFLIEAVVLSAFGGIIGILIGWGGSKLLSKIFATEVTLWSVALSFSFATLVGVVFGIAPAIKASKKDPIEALRYE